MNGECLTHSLARAVLAHAGRILDRARLPRSLVQVIPQPTTTTEGDRRLTQSCMQVVPQPTTTTEGDRRLTQSCMRTIPKPTATTEGNGRFTQSLVRLSPRSRGFSLAEVLLAMLFISIALFGFAALQQRLIYSSWKTELRNSPRENARSELAVKQATVRSGGTVEAEQVEGVNPGLYEIRSQVTWKDASAPRAGGNRDEQAYTFETYATHVRVLGWQQD